MGKFFKTTKHAPQRWLSLNRSLGVVIRLWHQLRKLYSFNAEDFPLDQGSNRDRILELYSLMDPVVAITRGGQHGSIPMSAEMQLALSKLKATTLAPTLKVGTPFLFCIRFGRRMKMSTHFTPASDSSYSAQRQRSPQHRETPCASPHLFQT